MLAVFSFFCAIFPPLFGAAITGTEKAPSLSREIFCVLFA